MWDGIIITPINVNEDGNYWPFNEQVPVQNISSQPPNIIISYFFGFGAGYTTADTLNPGKGYWVKTNANGIIQFIQY